MVGRDGMSMRRDIDASNPVWLLCQVLGDRLAQSGILRQCLFHRDLLGSHARCLPKCGSASPLSTCSAEPSRSPSHPIERLGRGPPLAVRSRRAGGRTPEVATPTPTEGGIIPPSDVRRVVEAAAEIEAEGR